MSSPTQDDLFEQMFEQMTIKKQKIDTTVQDKIYTKYSKYSIKKNAVASQSRKLSFLNHQAFLRDYSKTKEDGMLLYHGLGSGKSISSILMAMEKLKTKEYTKVCTTSSKYKELFSETAYEGSKCGRQLKEVR